MLFSLVQSSRAQLLAAPDSAPAPGRRPTLVEGAGSLLRLPSLRALLLLLLVGWIAEFSLSGRLGLYEDDYFFIGYAMGDDGAYLADRLRNVASWPQGRPVGFLLPALLTFVGDHLGGLQAIYVVGFLVVSLNAFLCYLVLRVHHPRLVAVSGALFFLLFPGDTTKMLLTHAFQLQPSLTFLLLAALLYLRGWKLPAYVVSAGSLLAYESGFLPFFAVPLLARRWDRRLPGELARHLAILVGIMVLAVLVRQAFGEERVTSSASGVADILPRVAGSLVLGPIRALLMFVYGPLRELRGWDLTTLLAAGACLPVVMWALFREASEEPQETGHAARAPIGGQRLPREAGAEAEFADASAPARRGWRSLLAAGPFGESARLLGAGLVLLVFAYGLAFTHFPPNAVMGRGTSVHLAATFGSAVVFAALASALVRAARRRRLGLYAVSALALYLAVLVGYQVTIQRDLAQSWQVQRAFWTQVIELSPDLEAGTVVLFPMEDPPTRYIATSSWGDAIALEQLYRLPREWSEPPRLFSVERNWSDRVAVRDGQLSWWMPAAWWDERWAPLPQGNVIFLELVDGRLQRRQGTLPVAGQTLRLKASPPGASAPWPRGPLYDYLIAPPAAARAS